MPVVIYWNEDANAELQDIPSDGEQRTAYKLRVRERIHAAYAAWPIGHIQHVDDYIRPGANLRCTASKVQPPVANVVIPAGGADVVVITGVHPIP